MDEGAAQAPEVQTIRGHPFVVGPRYHCIEFIGEGAYGIVIKASDNQADPANGENFGNYFVAELPLHEVFSCDKKDFTI